MSPFESLISDIVFWFSHFPTMNRLANYRQFQENNPGNNELSRSRNGDIFQEKNLG